VGIKENHPGLEQDFVKSVALFVLYVQSIEVLNAHDVKKRNLENDD